MSLLMILILRAKLGVKLTKLSHEVCKFDILTYNHSLHPLINEPAYFLDSSSLYIDVIFTVQPNLAMDLVLNILFNQIVIISWNLISSIYSSFIFPLTKGQTESYCQYCSHLEDN